MFKKKKSIVTMIVAILPAGDISVSRCVTTDALNSERLQTKPSRPELRPHSAPPTSAPPDLCLGLWRTICSGRILSPSLVFSLLFLRSHLVPRGRSGGRGQRSGGAG